MRKSFHVSNGWFLFSITLLLVATFGWTVFAQEMEKLKNTDDFRIEVTDVHLISQSGDALQLKEPFYALDSMVFHIGLSAPGDYVVYQATVTNVGNLDAYLNDLIIRFHNYADGPIQFTVSGVKAGSTELSCSDTNTILIKAFYDENYMGIVNEKNDHVTALVNLIYQPM